MNHDRRRFVQGALVASGAFLLNPLEALAAPLGHASLSFHNLHTGESLRTVFRERGRYVPDALVEIDTFLRDFRTGDVHRIDPKLLDLLAALSNVTGARGPFQVISGYRSPATNAMLHARSSGVAKHSLHMDGQAIDIRHHRVDVATLRRAALKLQRGGVGYYPRSNFVHVDTGRVRWWNG